MMIHDQLLDTSNYHEDHPLYSSKYRNQIGLFKNEGGSEKVFKEWIFLRPKLYAMKTFDDEEIFKAKGVLRSTMLKFLDYLTIYNSYQNPEFNEPLSLTVKQRRITSKKHQLMTVEYYKTALTILDDKRKWYCKNSSIPYGHFSLL